MSYAKLKKLVSARSPVFLCEGAGNKSRERFVAHISHTLRPPATAKGFAQLQKMFPKCSKQLLAFYKLHNGCILYEDKLSDMAGIELAKISDMASMTEEVGKWIDIYDEEGTDPFRTAIAIGQVPCSGNYFVMQPSGEDAGKVFYFCHDDYREEPYANSFDEFLGRISESPCEMLLDLGCYARYSDRKTKTQWIPIEYFPCEESSKRS
jgi:hypothetical protein